MTLGITEINGKPIKDYADLPFGAFKKIARTADPLWGYDFEPGEEDMAEASLAIRRAEREEDEFMEFLAAERESS